MSPESRLTREIDNVLQITITFTLEANNRTGYKTDHQAVLAFTDQCTSGGTGPYILGRPVKFSNSQDADNLHTIRKRMPIPFQ